MAFTFLPINNYRADELQTSGSVQMPVGMRIAYVFIDTLAQGPWINFPTDYLATIVLQKSDDNGQNWIDWDSDVLEGGRLASDGSGRLPFIARGFNTPLVAPVLLRCTFQQNQRRQVGLQGDFTVDEV